VDRYPGKVVTTDLTFPGVDARAHVQAERRGAPDDGLRATHGASRAIERGKEPVAGRLDLAAASAAQLLARRCVVRVE